MDTLYRIAAVKASSSSSMHSACRDGRAIVMARTAAMARALQACDCSTGVDNWAASAKNHAAPIKTRRRSDGSCHVNRGKPFIMRWCVLKNNVVTTHLRRDRTGNSTNTNPAKSNIERQRPYHRTAHNAGLLLKLYYHYSNLTLFVDIVRRPCFYCCYFFIKHSG